MTGLRISNWEYHAHPALSTSGMKLLLDCPAKFRYRKQRTTDAMRIGTAVHSYILEPDRELPIVGPDIPRRSTKDRKAWADFFELNGATIDTSKSATGWFEQFENQTGKIVVTQPEYEMIDSMCESVHCHERASQLLKHGDAELSFFADIDGVEVKCRPDYKSDVLVDVKTCADASARGFAKTCANYKYQLQQAVYQEVVYRATGERLDFVFIAVEKEYPYLVAVYELDEEAVFNGVYLLDKAIKTFIECTDNDIWPGYTDNEELSIPIYEPEKFIYDLGDRELIS